MKVDLTSNTFKILCLATGIWILSGQPGLTVSFTPPADNASPTQGSGGASRSGFQFVPPSDNAAPRYGTGGGSRGDNLFIPHPDNIEPSQRTGGASRDGVFIPTPEYLAPEAVTGGTSRANEYGLTEDLLTGSAVSMLAVTPPNFYGLTVSARPTFMAYLPPSSAHQAIFRLKDSSQSIVYEQIIPLDGKAGILTVQLPSDAPALITEQYYQWFVTLQTKNDLTPASPFVDAWIKRIEPTDAMLEAQESGDPLTMAEVLAQSGIWYDTSALLATLQAVQNSEDLMEHWSELLSSVDLDSLIEVPLLLSGSSH
ncbi:MAG: DUF928 domain-containing protein [Cyanobacteria bacterium P01_F01_bin.150]